MKTISRKLILLLVFAALVPMVIFGMIAIWTAREMAREIVVEENLEVAKRAAYQIKQYIDNGEAILAALAQNLGKTDLELWQKERVVRNYVLQFDQFRSIDLTDQSGRVIATSRLNPQGDNEIWGKAVKSALSGDVFYSNIFISVNFVPSMVIGIPVEILGEVQGGIVGELNLVEMWHLVDSIRIGEEGYALVVSHEGNLIAHGLGTAKERVIRQEHIGAQPIVEAALRGGAANGIYTNVQGLETIGVSVPIPGLGWALVIEQPTREAYAAATRLAYQLTVLIGVFLITMVLIGTYGGKRYIVLPIRELIRGIRSVGTGNLKDKVHISTKDEFQELGNSFNVMTEQLSKLQDEIRQKERIALLGRIAGGLVHDLKHPIKNIENAGRLVARDPDNRMNREFFEKVSAREFSKLNRFLDDILHLARPTPLQPIFISFSKLMDEVLEPLKGDERFIVETMGQGPSDAPECGKIHVRYQLYSPDLTVHADRFALERVLRNLVSNAADAMAGGGILEVSGSKVQSDKGHRPSTRIVVSDTGTGITPEHLKTLFVDFTTTKRRGIGLGLPICKKIIEDHNGSIEIISAIGKGTTVILNFPFPPP